MPILDNFHDYTAGLTGPICGAFNITPNDTGDLAQVTRGLMVSDPGTVSVILKDGDSIDLPSLVAGVLYPFRVSRVLLTGTTAAGIIGLV